MIPKFARRFFLHFFKIFLLPKFHYFNKRDHFVSSNFTQQFYLNEFYSWLIHFKENFNLFNNLWNFKENKNNNYSFNQSKLDLKSDFYSTGNSASFIEDSNNEANKIDLDTSESSKNSNLGDVIKSKVSNVFKLVDWSSSSSSPSVATSPIQSETASEKQLSLKHRRHHRSRNSVKQQKQSDIEEDEYKERQIQLSELLQIDFGMPFNLFSEFNILHPYLSLYYLSTYYLFSMKKLEKRGA